MDGKYGCGTEISRLIAAALLCAFFLGGRHVLHGQHLQSVSHYDREIKQSSRQLDSIRQILDQGRERVKNLQKEEGSCLEQLEQIEKNMDASQAYLKLLTGRIDTVETVIAALGDSLAQEEKRLESRQRIMMKRLRKAYTAGPQHRLLTIFSAQSPLEAINRARYMEELNRYDRDLVSRIEKSRLAIETNKKARRQELDHLAALRSAKEKERLELAAEEARRKETLSGVRKKRENYEAMVKELEAAQRELAAMIRLLETKRKKAKKAVPRRGVVAFEKSRGRLPWPVEGTVVTNFGKVVHPKYGTVIMNNGVDIAARRGEPVYCVAGGTVIHTGWMRGLGKMVIVDHTDGFLSIYAHLEQIDVNVDQKVEMAAVLGRVGETGSLGGTRLHFELRKSAEALNPVEWLEKR